MSMEDEDLTIEETLPPNRLYTHELHPHQVQNVNRLHAAEQRASGFNAAIAVTLTKSVGSMWTAYTFVGLALLGLLAILGILSPLVALLVAWTSQTLIQLVLLPVIMVGQNVLGRKSELQADEAFQTTLHSFHDIQQVMTHLSRQDEELLKHTELLILLVSRLYPAGHEPPLQKKGQI